MKIKKRKVKILEISDGDAFWDEKKWVGKVVEIWNEVSSGRSWISCNFSRLRSKEKGTFYRVKVKDV